MGLQVAKEREFEAWQIFPVIEAVAGFGNVQNMMAFSGHNAVVMGSDIFSNATVGVYLGGTYFAGSSEYDSDFVASILMADAATPEAGFDNVVDMLDWLNRD